jgi:acyloxyacyl hydrolase
MGMAILGDSATAHFRLPPNYLVAANLSLHTFSRLVPNLENELDFPALSWSTGHESVDGYSPDIYGPVDSIYKRLRENNLCNNNDYQNIGVNGASSGTILHELQNILSRDNRISTLPQKPLLLFMAMIGNDVCNHEFTSRTTPEEYHQNLLQSILDLDPRLPKGTKIVLIGLVDGRILYDSMHDLIHPLGSTNQDLTYSDFYDYLNCLEISPCAGWMNSNQTVRDNLSATASAMRDYLPVIVEETRGLLKNVEVFYLGDVLNDAVKDYMMRGGKGSDLIEPSDGFHPSQYGNAILAEYIWNATVEAGIIPPSNPNNDAIRARFFPNEVAKNAPFTVIQ